MIKINLQCCALYIIMFDDINLHIFHDALALENVFFQMLLRCSWSNFIVNSGPTASVTCPRVSPLYDYDPSLLSANIPKLYRAIGMNHDMSN